MNRKTTLKLIGMLLAGGLAGAIGTLAILKVMDSGGRNLLSRVGGFMVDYNVFLMVGLLVLLHLPSNIMFAKAKKVYESLNQVAEEALDALEASLDWDMNFAFTLNGVFIILNFLLFGTTFEKEGRFFVPMLVVFLVNALMGSILEIRAVRTIQKHDPRIKGDPTSFGFQKDYLDSCDEAEQLKIYKAGYHAFQASRGVAWVVIILAVLGNMLFDLGSYAIVMAAMIMLSQVIMYGYYAMRHDEITKAR